MINVYEFIENTRVEGPGLRYCIYLQGCSIQCNGCNVPETWKSNDQLYTVEEISSKVLSNNKIEGVTFSGGEPFDQAKELSDLAAILKKHDLSIVVFTGYTLDYLKNSNNQDYLNLLNHVDLLIDGPFDLSKRTLKKPLVGSSNQNYNFLTDRYSIEDISKENKLEFHLKSDGQIMVSGIYDKKEIESLLKDIW